VEGPLCAAGDVRLIETLLWDGGCYPRLGGHLARLTASAAALGHAHDRAAVVRALAVAPGAPLRVRLTLGRAGDVAVTAAALTAVPAIWVLALAPQRIDSADPWLRHKTSRRALYDRARAALPAGVDEWLFANERDEVCEGSITNLFYDAGDGLCTPPLRCGCLPGVLRAELLASGRCRERALPLPTLGAVRLWVGNAVRGLQPARWSPP
jgi:4-amino-4-deoxychorismate lyase